MFGASDVFFFDVALESHCGYGHALFNQGFNQQFLLRTAHPEVCLCRCGSLPFFEGIAYVGVFPRGPVPFVVFLTEQDGEHTAE